MIGLELLKKAETAVYKLLKEDGKQSEMNDIVEYIICAMICLNVVLIVFESMGLNGSFGAALAVLRMCFFYFFLIEYILRIWIADMTMNDRMHPIKSRVKYFFSFRAIVDLLALLPVLLGSAVIDFRIFRILRLFRIAQLKSLRRYTDILSRVFKLKKAQLFSSLFIVLVFMLTSAVIIYDFENKAQPDTFNNILSCLWWAMSATTTVGYGDMLPITAAGKIFGALISVFGVFLMAIPVAILTSGFFEVARDTDARRSGRK